MTIVYILILCLVGLANSYQRRFNEAVFHIGRALSERGGGRDYKGAITPPAFAYFALGVNVLFLVVIAFGFFQYGFLMGLVPFLGFGVVTSISSLFLLPKPESPQFRKIVISSMIRRHANYLRDGDQLRATAMANLLQLAGIPISEFIRYNKGERVVNKQDTDRIFGLNQTEWNEQAKRMVYPEGEVRLNSAETGTRVVTFNPKTGIYLTVQPFFPDAQGPPEVLRVGNYYPDGTFPEFSDGLKRYMETAARSDLGPDYSVKVSFNRMASPGPDPGLELDVLSFIITRAKK